MVELFATRLPARPASESSTLALPPANLLDHDLDRIAEPEHSSPTPAGQRGADRVQLEVVAGHPPGREEALEHVTEADEQAEGDHADDLPRPRLLPAVLEEPRLEQPGEADVVSEVLELGRFALAGRGVLGEIAEVLRERLVGDPELAKQRPVDDQIGIAPNWRPRLPVLPWVRVRLGPFLRFPGVTQKSKVPRTNPAEVRVSLCPGKRVDLQQLSGQKLYPVIEFENGATYREESKDMAATIRAGKLDEKRSATN